jgi:hypothetical protein
MIFWGSLAPFLIADRLDLSFTLFLYKKVHVRGCTAVSSCKMSRTYYQQNSRTAECLFQLQNEQNILP